MVRKEYDWTVEFPNADGFEVQPTNLTIRQDRKKLDFARVELPWEVGEKMKPHTRYASGSLYGKTKAVININGEPVWTMLFKPDGVTYARTQTNLELYDIQQALDSGEIDERRKRVKLEEIYRHIFSRRDSTAKRLIPEIKFTVPDNVPREIFGTKASGGIRDTYKERATGDGILKTVETVPADAKKALDSDFAVNFEKLTPMDAIWKLNEKFGVTSWVDEDGTLWIGQPEARSGVHLAAPDDNRVWRWTETNINHSSEPVQTVAIEGRWATKDGVDLNPLDYFDGKAGDLKIIGTATRSDVEYGQTYRVKDTKATADSAAAVARQKLREASMNQNEGEITIKPSLSGTIVSDPKEMKAGDVLHVVPDDTYWEDEPVDGTTGEVGDSPTVKRTNSGVVNNEVYFVRGIEHDVSANDWTLTAKIGMIPSFEIETKVLYFNPESQEFVNEDDIFDGSWIEGI